MKGTWAFGLWLALVAPHLGCNPSTRALETHALPAATSDAAEGVIAAPHNVNVGVDAGVDDLSATLEIIRAHAGMPAMGAAVWRGGDLIAIGATGKRSQGDPTPVTIDDQWHLGSDTKAMTATLIGLYVDRGKIHFEDTLGALFRGETIDPAYAKVTLEQLLQHRGGAPATMPVDVQVQIRADGASPNARTKAVRALLSRAPAQAPGTFAYANAGYILAGAALERALGSTWERIIQKDLFDPLHMTSCGFGAPGTAAAVDQPRGHQVEGATITPVVPGPQADNPPTLGPAGTVRCSLTDWGKFLAVHLAGARGESTILSKETMARLHTPPPGGDYAGGWMIMTRGWAGGAAITHSGSNTLWYATVWLAPAKNMAFAAVTNRGDEAAGLAVDSVFGPLIHGYAK